MLALLALLPASAAFAADGPWKQCPQYNQPDYLVNLAGEAEGFNAGVLRPSSYAAFSEHSKLVRQVACLLPAIQIGERDPSIAYFGKAARGSAQIRMRDTLQTLFRTLLRVVAMDPEAQATEAPLLLAMRTRVALASTVNPRAAIADEDAFFADEVRPLHYEQVGMPDRVAIGASQLLGRAEAARLATPGGTWESALARYENGTEWFDHGVALAADECASRAAELSLESAATSIMYAAIRLDAFGPNVGNGAHPRLEAARNDAWRQAAIAFRAAYRSARFALEAAEASRGCADDLDAEALAHDSEYLLSQAADGLARVELLQAIDPETYAGGGRARFGSAELEEAARFALAHAASEYEPALALWTLRIDTAQGDMSYWEFNTAVKTLAHDATAATSGARSAFCYSVRPDPTLPVFPELRDPRSADEIVGGDTLQLIDETWKCHPLLRPTASVD